jgi:hypothetical protein
MSAIIIFGLVIVPLFLIMSIMRLSSKISEEERTREDARKYAKKGD